MTPQSTQSSRFGMSKNRRAVINLMLLGLLGGSAYEIGVRGEHWPFSSYPMFSKTRREARVVHYALLALPQDGSEAFPLYKSKHIHPFLWYRQREAFRRMLEGPGGKAAVKKGLADTIDRYEQGRQQGRHDGPRLRALQLYRVDWSIDPHAPDLVRKADRSFIAEVLAEEAIADSKEPL
ncbi:MAG: hypothetical protein AAF152_00495 [Cyanobacteria bacterium P01_A01_bin.114]